MKQKHPNSQRSHRTSSLSRVMATTIALSSVSMVMSSITAQASTVFAGGSGTTTDPYRIATAAQLVAMASNVNANLTDPQGTSYAGAAYELDANIDLSTTTWTSIKGFAGVFDGNGYSISNLSGSNGLFSTANATIENVALLNVNISSSSLAGALVGVNAGTITNVYSSGSVKSSTDGVGGLVGANVGTISYSQSAGTVTSTGAMGAGGLVGDNNGTVEDSYSSASATFAGSNEADLGGLVGWNQSGGSLTDVYATGAVTEGITDDRAGGLVGENDGSITDGYATGGTTGGTLVGGLVGQEYYAGSAISNSFWDTTTTNQSIGVGGGGASPSTIQLTGETDINMKLPSTFSSWPSVWTVTNGYYPYFGLQLGTQHLSTATVGVPYVAYLQPNYATGMAPYTWSITGSLPQGLSLNSNGEISGTPTTSGKASFTVQVKDSLGATATETLSIDTLTQLQPPTGLTHSGATQTGWTESWSTVSGATGYNVYINGAKVNTSPVTGTTYNVSGESAGTTYSVTVTAVNTGGESAASKADSVTTLPNTPGVPTGLAHSNVTQTSWTESWSAVSGATGYNVYINGAKANTSPVTSTTYNVSGESLGTTYSVTVTAISGGGESAQSAADTVTTLAPSLLAPSLSVATNWVWNAQYGVPFSALQLEAAAGHGPYTWTLMQGTLPVGLTLSADGILRGIPMSPNGSDTFTVQVKDATGATASKSLSIQVWGAPALAMDTTSLLQGTMGQTYSEQLVAQGGTPFQWSLTSGSLPKGVSLSSSGRLSGLPLESGNFAFTVQVSDGAGSPVSQSFQLNILPLSAGEVILDFNGKIQTIPVVMEHGAPYMPIWYLMQRLNGVGNPSHWEAHDWYLNSVTQPYLYHVEAGSGTASIYLNGVLVQNVNSVIARDPSSHRATTFMPLWSLTELLNRIGYHSSWDGTIWSVNN